MSGDESTRPVLPIADRRTTWRVVAQDLRARPGIASTTLIAFALSNVCGLLAPWILGWLVDAAIDDAAHSDIVKAVVVLGVAGVGAGGFLLVGYVYMARLGEGTLAMLRERVVARAVRLPTSVLDRAGSGDLLTRVGDDVATVTQAINNTLPMVVGAALATGLTAVSMFGLDWRLGLAGLACAPIYAFAARWYVPRAVPLYERERLAVGERAQTLVGALDGSETLRAYRAEDPMVSSIAARSQAAMGLRLRTFRLLTTFTGWMNRAELVGLAALLSVGFLLVDDDAVSVGAVTTAALLFHRLFGPIGTLMVTFDDVQAAGVSLARLVGVIEMAEAAAPDAGQVTGSPSVRVESLTYRYDDGPVILDDVSLAVEPGERLALVGASGAGKTTLASVIAGRFMPDAGDVRVAGVSTRQLGEAGAREWVAMVSQDVHVFYGPLREDLRLAAPDAGDDDLRAALDSVGALSWVDALPDGLSTVVGENAHPLTAARAQQVALARLVLADRPIVILDEATAEAGSTGAYELECAADGVVAGRTSIVVAHRLTQALAADRVAVLEGGRVVEFGPPAELIERGAAFARLWDAWHASSGDVSVTTPS
ncbi:ABC transporter ATP-binding protein [Solicola gregarius]|uniref:ABC transporter ATP-binding protein/permease n=1 Tax=Solicola gregarius TaxID=2908642 RepID=A0AA46TFS4_9ACTN|nr:ABC transporter ATP-binding protein [Solicola gregarius]UYM04355.1 ABC transporter ATP-binding protein/permease [Solicola gregarius]